MFVILLLVLLASIIVGHRAVALLRRARQMRAAQITPRVAADGRLLLDQEGKHIGTIDPRDAVLYLRPFGEDAVAAGSRGRGNVYFSHIATEEEQLAATLEPIGRLVAIGKPGEPLPEVGAIRMYVRDDEWQSVITEWLALARLVVLRLGFESAGFIWEITQAPRLVDPEKVVLLVSQKQVGYEAFRQRVQHLFPRGLPAYSQKTVDLIRRNGLTGLIYFERDWTPRFVWIRPLFLSMGFVHHAKSVFRRAFRPVFAQLGVGSGKFRTPVHSVAGPPQPR
jgi:hypothetical protein